MEGYQDKETLGYINEHLKQLLGAPYYWDTDEDPKNYSKIVEGDVKVKILSKLEQCKMHECIITNFNDVESLYRCSI